MKKINALPKRIFDSRINNDIISMHSNNICFISILDEDNHEQKYDLSNSNFLQVRMWDVEEELIDKNKIYLPPSDSELTKIVKFVNDNSDKKIFIIHCSAGVSRSGAVALFIKDKFHSEVDNEVFTRENKISPNLYILHRLKLLDI